MEKEKKITAPEGCEIEKVELVDGVAVVTFKEKERKLPKKWEEFCEMYPIKNDECYIENYSNIIDARGPKRYKIKDKNVLPDRATSEGVLALCQLIQLRNCYNGDWAPDWNDDTRKYFIVFDYQETIIAESTGAQLNPLYFKTAELRGEFVRNFRPLIEKLKPLYGIKEGGEK